MNFDYPSELPICSARNQIIEDIKESQVVIVSGQTGSGKTTQIPKMALELGRGGRGKQIVHTHLVGLLRAQLPSESQAKWVLSLAKKSATKCVLTTKAHLKQSFA